MLAIDIGACEGRFIDIMNVLDIDVIAFEPQDDLVEKLKEKYKSKIIQAACSNKDGEAILYPTESGRKDGASIISDKSNIDINKGEVVKLINIGRWLAELGRKVDIIKIDCEGAELNVLESIRDNYDPKSINHYLVETHFRKINNKKWDESLKKIIREYNDMGIVLHSWS